MESVTVAKGAGQATLAPRRLLSDARLTRLATEGDQSAFGEIYRRYERDLHRYCRSLVGEDDARDALQATFVSALRSLPGEEREIEIKPWLYRVAHNEAISITRRRRPAEPLEAADAIAVEGVAASAERKGRLRELVRDLGELSERQRGALVMRELSGLGYEEIATAFDTTVPGAKQSVYKARVALQEKAEGRALLCSSVRETVSEKDGRLLASRRIRAHLRECQACQDFRAGIATRRADLALLSPPVAAIPAASLLGGILGGGEAGAGGGATGVGMAGVAGKLAGASVVTKAVAIGAATVAVGTAAVGARDLASDRGVSGGAEIGVGAPESAKSDRASEGQSSGAASGSHGKKSDRTSSAGRGGNASSGGGREEDQAGGRADGPPGSPDNASIPGHASAGPPVTPGGAATPGSPGARPVETPRPTPTPSTPAPVTPPASGAASGGGSASGAGGGAGSVPDVPAPAQGAGASVPTLPVVPGAGAASGRPGT